jgi:hypothetical protein
MTQWLSRWLTWKCWRIKSTDTCLSHKFKYSSQLRTSPMCSNSIKYTLPKITLTLSLNYVRPISTRKSVKNLLNPKPVILWTKLSKGTWKSIKKKSYTETLNQPIYSLLIRMNARSLILDLQSTMHSWLNLVSIMWVRLCIWHQSP